MSDLAAQSAPNATNGELNILVTLQPQQTGGYGSQGFISTLAPVPLDWTSSGAGAYSSLMLALATAGQTGEQLEATTSAYLKAVDFPIFGLPFILADAIGAYGDEGAWGAVRSAVGDLEGYLATAVVGDAASATVTSALASGAALLGLAADGVPVAAFVGTTVIAIGAGYLVNKAVQYGLQYIAENAQSGTSLGNGEVVYPDGSTEFSLSDGSTQYHFANGLVYTMKADGSGTATVSGGDSYQFDSSGNLTGATYTNGTSVGFADSGTAATFTDSDGVATNLTLSANADGSTTVNVAGKDIDSSLTLGVNSDGQMSASTGGTNYGFTLTTDSAGDQNITTQVSGVFSTLRRKREDQRSARTVSGTDVCKTVRQPNDSYKKINPSGA